MKKIRFWLPVFFPVLACIFLILGILIKPPQKVSLSWEEIRKCYLSESGMKTFFWENKVPPPFLSWEAKDYIEEQGIKMQAATEGGMNLSFIEDGDWIAYSGSSSSGITELLVRASSYRGGRIEIRLDSLSGQVIGDCTIPATGGWQQWVTVSCPVETIQGDHKFYFLFTGDSTFLFNINWLIFLEQNSGIKKAVVNKYAALYLDPLFSKQRLNGLNPVVLLSALFCICFYYILYLFLAVQGAVKSKPGNTLEKALIQSVSQPEQDYTHVAAVSYEEEKLEKITAIIKDNYMDSGLNSKKIYKWTGITPEKMAKLFLNRYGMTFKQYLNHIRLTEVKRLLRETSLNINDIVDKTGYNSVHYFNRLFKMKSGQSPSEFRDSSVAGIIKEKNGQKPNKVDQGIKNRDEQLAF